MISVRDANWETECVALLAVRREVFIVEQQVSEDLEVDGRDASCHHVLAEAADGRPVGTARMLADGHIGRVAVLRDFRGMGIGTRLVRALLERGDALGARSFHLDSQVSALAFYERLGFLAEGPVFDEAGIAHRRMVLRAIGR